MICKFCNHDGEFIKIYDIDGTKLPNAETYKGYDLHNDIRSGFNIYECPNCGNLKKFKRINKG